MKWQQDSSREVGWRLQDIGRTEKKLRDHEDLETGSV